MKKIATFILLTCIILTFAACNDNGNPPLESTAPESTAPESTEPESTEPEDTTPEITLQEVYDAGKTLSALLGDHENVYAQITSNGKVIREDYLSKKYAYSYSSAEYMDMGFEYADLVTDNAEYFCFENTYALNVRLTPNGMVEMTDTLSTAGADNFISSEVVNNDTASIVEKDGVIIVTINVDVDKITMIGEDVVSCTETYTLDAKTREITAVKTTYTYKDGTVEEGIVTITRDVEAPEGMKPFLEYVQKTENMRTVTIISNPGTEVEKAESIKTPKGLSVALGSDWNVEEIFTMYADAACTQVIEGDPDPNSDVTIYVKWDK